MMIFAMISASRSMTTFKIKLSILLSFLARSLVSAAFRSPVYLLVSDSRKTTLSDFQG
jgi:hypothetical protein